MLLELEFPTGAVYRYHGVPAEVYEQLVKSSTPGKFYNENIKRVYPSTLVEPRKLPKTFPWQREDIEFGVKLVRFAALVSPPLLVLLGVAQLLPLEGLRRVLTGFSAGGLLLVWSLIFTWGAFGGHGRGR